jgi:hypothetical protein
VNWIHLIEDRIQLAGSCEYSDEPLISIRGGELLDKLSDY